MTENSRAYPNGTLASSVIGTVGVDAEGLAGIEFQLNDMLLVNNVKDAYKRDARGHLYLSPSAADEKKKPPHVELTIDRTIQHIAERELSAAIEKARAKSGTAIVLDVTNGDVLAMATFPTFDPNKFGQHSVENWKNRAVIDAYEPGSTFKAMVIAGALDRQVVNPEQVFDCGMGKLVVGKDIVNDAHPHGKLSVADVVKVSSNIGAAKIEAQLGKENVYKLLREFGFGEASGIDIPGEARGILSNPKSWSDIQFVTIAFGQGVSATPLQMALAFGALSNGGELLRPYLIKRVVGPDNVPLYERKKEVRSYPIRAETSNLMRKLLARVVEQGGTGMLAASKEYLVAGKTGTAQKAGPNGGYMNGKYYSSFIGFAPVESPRIVVYVGVDEPKGYYYGGQVAAPVFKNITDDTLHYLSIPAQKGLVIASASVDSANLAEGPMPYQEGFEVSSVDAVLQKKEVVQSEERIKSEISRV
ncbi:stage V sporulation protein D, partial [sediment metagenome]